MTSADVALLDLRLVLRAALEGGGEGLRTELQSDPILLDEDEHGNAAFDLGGATYGVVRRGDLRADVFWRERRVDEGLVDEQVFDYSGRVVWTWCGEPLGELERRWIVREV